jgi:ureidoglycolate amidohydrolase
MNILIDRDRLVNELETLASFSDAPAPAVTRIVFSSADLAARQYLKTLFEQAGLDVREDAVGNTFARWNGADRDAPAAATGSHIDAIPHSGRFDGTAGVLGGLEAIRALMRAGLHPRRSIELVLFTSEEPTRFGIGCLGSRLLSGSLSPNAAALLKDAAGATLDEVRGQAGFNGSLDGVTLQPGRYSSFVELHIEQGPLLEREGVPIGVVTNIAAPAALRISIDGAGGHAGAVLMPERRDAFLAAAEIALAVETAARSTGAIDTVATTGVCEVFPGAVNSIPSRVRMEVDVRDTDLARRDAVLRAIADASDAIAGARRVSIHREILNADAPAQCAPAVIAALTEACESLGIGYRRMVSRAYHDTLFLSRIAPSAMLFIPCRDGVSHRPDEYAAPEDLARGALVLAHCLARLAQ